MDDVSGMVLPIVIIIVICLAVIVYAILLNKSVNRGQSDVFDSELEDRHRSMKISRVASYIPPKITNFYQSLKSAMPKSYIILPNIAIELLFQRAYRAELNLSGQYASFGIFTERFVPVLVVDLADYSITGESVFRVSDKVKKFLKDTGIPVMEYSIRDTYSIDDLRRAIAKAMNPLYEGK